MKDPVRILFVCLGNICRSPMAEGVFRHLIEREGVAERFEVDSAGTSAYHEGEGPDPRAAEAAARRGVRLSGRARRIRPSDLERFDYVLAMDGENLAVLERLAGGAGARSNPGGKHGAEAGPRGAGSPDASAGAGGLRETAARAGDGARPRARIGLLREFDPEAAGDLDVPDPYFGGARGFDRVFELVERSCRGLLEHVRRERGF